MSHPPQSYLIAVVEVNKDDRILCQAVGCGHSVYKRIHVVHDGDAITVVGSECFKRIYTGLEQSAQNPRYGSSEGRLLTPDERLALLENTGRLIAILEAEHLEAERLSEAQRLAAAARAAERAQNQATQIGRKVGYPIPGRSATRPSPGFNDTRNISASELAELRKQAKDKLQAENPSIDLNSPGWAGFVNLEVRRLLKLMER